MDQFRSGDVRPGGPQAPLRHRHHRQRVAVPLTGGHDQRWIDNYCTRLNLSGWRFGGEEGGFTPVVNFTRYNEVGICSAIVLENSYVSAWSNAKRRCAIYCEEVPNSIIVRDTSLVGVPAVLVSPRLDLRRYFKGVGPEGLRFSIADAVGLVWGALPELLAKPVILPRDPVAELSPADTEKALARAVQREQRRPAEEPAPSLEFAGHQAQTDPARYVDLIPPRVAWDLSGYMDATLIPHSEFLALGQVGAGMILLRRTRGENNWPHVLLREVKLDLGRTPWLTWRQRPPLHGRPTSLAVRVKNLETGDEGLLVDEAGWASTGLYAYDLRKIFGLESGEHRFEVNLYDPGFAYGQSVNDVYMLQPGEYTVVEFLRAEAD